MNEPSFRINKDAFYNALQTAKSAIVPNSPIPSLNGIRIDIQEDQLVITGSNNDISIQVLLKNTADQPINLHVEKQGSIVVDSAYLLDIVKKMDSDEIQISVLDGTLIYFVGNKAEFKINGYNPDDYPHIDFSLLDTPFMLSTNKMADMVLKTAFATSKKETRLILTGVNMKAENGKITVTATDSYRLARMIVAADCEPFNITVPAKTLFLAKSIFTTGSVSIAVSSRKIQFQSENVIMQSNLLEGKFPEIDRLISSDFSRTLMINRQALITALDRTAFIKTENMTVIRLQVENKDDVIISTRSQEIGESHENLNACSYEGEALDISFSGNYVGEAARALSQENIVMLFTNEMRPFILKNSMDDTELLQLVLPVRTYN